MTLAALLLAVLAAAPSPQGGPERTEVFELRQAGVDGPAGSLGALRRVVRALPSGGWRAERELLLECEETRLLQFETYTPAGALLVHREVRAGDGRTLRVAWTPGPDPRPEWASYASGRRRVGTLPSVPDLTAPLACVERLRWGILREREVLVEPLGVTVETRRPTERLLPTPFGVPLRRIDLQDAEGAPRGTLWFLGDALLARTFSPGGPIAVRVGEERYRALVDRFEERAARLGAAAPVAASRRTASRG